VRGHADSVKITSVRWMLICALLGGVLAAGIAATQERDYVARAFVIQVPSDMGGEKGLALARTDRVLGQAIAFSGVPRTTTEWMREHSSAEITSRLDLAFTVKAPGAQMASALATGYAKAFRLAIPDDRGLPVRGRGARDAQPELSPLGWGVIGGLVGLAVGAALVVTLEGVSNGSPQAPRRASRACAPPTSPTPS
jgi:hypothetical protein